MNIRYLVLVLAAGALAGVVAAQPIVMEEKGLLPGDLLIAPAVNSQQDHAVARGANQYLVVWLDMRARSSGSQSIQSDGDIFGIRLDSSGNPIDAAPFPIASGFGYQQKPRVAWNGSNWLVLFVSQEPTAGYFEDQMRAVRVSPSGQVLDATPLSFPPTQFTPDTIGLQLAGLNGQWLVTRCVYHNDGYGTFLAGQRIDGSGQLLDQTPIMLLDWVYGQTTLLTGPNEYLIAGPDWSDSTITKGRRLSSSGQPLGASFTLPGSQIASSGSEYYVVWIKDYVNLVGSRVSSTGTVLTPAGTTIVPNYSQYNHSTLAHDGAQWWLEWGAADILRTVRINGTGTVLDPNGGVLLPISIGGNINNAYNTTLVGRPGGGALLLWHDSRVALGYDSNVFALPVNAGNVAGAERCVSTASGNQRNPALSTGPSGTAAVVFVSEFANDDRVLVHLLSSDGRATTPEPIEVFRGPTIGVPGIAFNGRVYMVVWDKGASGLTPTSIQARRMNPDGTFVDALPIDVMPGFNPAVEALGNNFLVAGARFGTYPQNIYLFGNRIDGLTGSPLDGPSGVNLGGSYVNGMPRVRTDGTQWFVCAHSQWSHNSSQGDAILARVPMSGTPTQAENPTPFSGGSGDLDLAFSGSNYLLVWRQNSLSNANNLVAGRIMNLDGSFASASFTIAEAAGRQLRPTVAWDGTNYIVALDDQRNQSAFFDARTDIYGVRVSQGGTVLDAAAFPIVDLPDGACSPSVLAIGNGQVLVASTRYLLTPPMDTYRVGMTMLGASPVVCMADFNQINGVTIHDVMDFLSAWFAGSSRADVNGVDGITPEDIFDFLNAWFIGC